MNMILKNQSSGRRLFIWGSLIFLFGYFIQAWPLLAADYSNENFNLAWQNRRQIEAESWAVKGKQPANLDLYADDFHSSWKVWINRTFNNDLGQPARAPGTVFSLPSQEEKTALTKAGRFNKFHLSGSLEYIKSPTGADFTNTMRRGIFKYPQEVSALLACIQAPMNASVISFSEFLNISLLAKAGFEFSLSRKFAIGLLYSYLGTHTITGDWQGATLSPGSGDILYYNQHYYADLSGKSEAKAYFLTGSFFLIPDMDLSIPSFEFMFGIGLNHTKLDYAGYSLGFPDLTSAFYPALAQLDGDEKTITKDSLSYLFSMDIIILGRNLFRSHWSLSLGTSYIIAPVKIPPVQIIYSHCSGLNSSGIRSDIQVIPLTISLPGGSINFGGLTVGLKSGFHF